MEEKTIGLSNSEWRMMENLWESSPKTATQLIKAMEEETGWAKSTTKTILKRMEQKGYIAYREGAKARATWLVAPRLSVILISSGSSCFPMKSTLISISLSVLLSDSHSNTNSDTSLPVEKYKIKRAAGC